MASISTSRSHPGDIRSNDDPLAFIARYPMALSSIGFARGIIALNHENVPMRAEHAFELAVSYGERLRAALAAIGQPNPDLDILD